jgi:hypothetical protein
MSNFSKHGSGSVHGMIFDHVQHNKADLAINQQKTVARQVMDHSRSNIQ